jgi:hypothetical protein
MLAEEARIRESINPAYAHIKGTESYERRELVEEIDSLRTLLCAYVQDESRFLRGEGEPYGSISTDLGIAARLAVKA